MRPGKMKAQITGVSYLKMGGVVININGQRASQSLCESRAVSLFLAFWRPRSPGDFAACARNSPLAEYRACFSPRIFEQTKDCSQSSAIVIVITRYAISNNHSNRRATEYH